MSRIPLTLVLTASAALAVPAFAQDEVSPVRANVRLRETATTRGTTKDPHGSFTLNVSVQDVETDGADSFSVDIGDLEIVIPLRRGRFDDRIVVGDLDLRGSVLAKNGHVSAKLRGRFSGSGASIFGSRAFAACSDRSHWDGTLFALEAATVSVGQVQHTVAIGVAGRSDRMRLGDSRFDLASDDQFTVSLGAVGRSAVPGKARAVVQLLPKLSTDRWDGRVRGQALLFSTGDARLKLALDGGEAEPFLPFDSEALDLSQTIRRGEGVVSREIAGQIVTQLRFDAAVQSSPGAHTATVFASGRGLRGADASRDFDAPSADAPLLLDVDAHSLEVRSDGLVRGWGNNDFGVVGDGLVQRNPFSPVPLTGPADVRAVGAGEFFSVAVDGFGSTWLWGQYDAVTPGFAAMPELFTGLPPLLAVAAGSAHGLGLDAAGRVWSFGLNDQGQLGDGTLTDRTRDPDPVEGLPPITAIAAGEETSLALDEDGVVWTWGMQNLRGIGNGLTPVSVRKLPMTIAIAARSGGFAPISTALAFDGTVWTWGGLTYLPVQIGEDFDHVIAISSGGDHDLALRDDGTVWAWGRNDAGQLGNGLRAASDVPVQVPGLADIVRIVAGNRVSFAVDASGAVWIFGDTTDFLADWGTRTLPVLAPREFVPGNYAFDAGLGGVIGPK